MSKKNICRAAFGVSQADIKLYHTHTREHGAISAGKKDWLLQLGEAIIVETKVLKGQTLFSTLMASLLSQLP